MPAMTAHTIAGVSPGGLRAILPGPARGQGGGFKGSARKGNDSGGRVGPRRSGTGPTPGERRELRWPGARGGGSVVVLEGRQHRDGGGGEPGPVRPVPGAISEPAA